jgi:Mn2+/Fe2+ NRAMP family transporter
VRVSKLVVVLYLVIGVIVAAQDDYFQNLDMVKRVISMLLAIVLWPLVLAGVDLRLR